jgi:hypothetical protein
MRHCGSLVETTKESQDKELEKFQTEFKTFVTQAKAKDSTLFDEGLNSIMELLSCLKDSLRLDDREAAVRRFLCFLDYKDLKTQQV